MSASNPTFEEVDKHIQAADLSVFQPGGKLHPAPGAPAAAALPQICPMYKTVRPILLLIENALIIPKKWRDAIKLFVQFMDIICP